MSTNKIYCIGDGYAHGHIWPEWPQILKSLLPQVQIVQISGVGAGHEFLISELLDQNPQNSDVLFQWPNADRFDKLIEDKNWEDRVKNDPVYFFNTYDSPHGTWWLSSASQDPEILHYHQTLVQPRQHFRRQSVAKTLLKGYLENQQCRYFEFSNKDQEEFIKKSYPSFRGTEIQPSPIAHFYYVIDVVVPKMGYHVDQKWVSELENRIKNHVWKPYDPKREDVWNEISNA